MLVICGQSLKKGWKMGDLGVVVWCVLGVVGLASLVIGLIKISLHELQQSPLSGDGGKPSSYYHLFVTEQSLGDDLLADKWQTQWRESDIRGGRY